MTPIVNQSQISRYANKNSRAGEMQLGDLVKCTFPGGYPLTLGKVYEVLDHKGGWITLMSDAGTMSQFAAVRFEKVNDSPPRVDRSVA